MLQLQKNNLNSKPIEDLIDVCRIQSQIFSLSAQVLEYMNIHEMDLQSYAPNHLIYKFGRLSKGRILVLRSVLLLPHAFALRVICMVFSRIILYCRPESVCSLDSMATDVIIELLRRSPPPELIFICGFLMSPDNQPLIPLILRSKLGASVVSFFLDLGHLIRQHEEPSSPNVVSWFNLFSDLFGTIAFRLSIVFDELTSETNDPFLASEDLLWHMVLGVLSHASPAHHSLIALDTSLR